MYYLCAILVFYGVMFILFSKNLVHPYVIIGIIFKVACPLPLGHVEELVFSCIGVKDGLLFSFMVSIVSHFSSPVSQSTLNSQLSSAFFCGWLSCQISTSYLHPHSYRWSCLLCQCRSLIPHYYWHIPPCIFLSCPVTPLLWQISGCSCYFAQSCIRVVPMNQHIGFRINWKSIEHW